MTLQLELDEDSILDRPAKLKSFFPEDVFNVRRTASLHSLGSYYDNTYMPRSWHVPAWVDASYA